MASKVQIFNLALVLLEQNIVNSPTQDIITAINLLNVYDLIRQELLRSHPWNFAVKRNGSLAQDVDAPESEFQYSYTLPSDCLKVIKLINNQSSYVIEGRKLLTDDASVSMKYIFNVTDESQFDSGFTRAFAYELALAVGPSLGVTENALERIRKQYEKLIKRSKGIDSQEDYPVNIYPSSTWITIR